jgi:protoporphyrinogen oxidase
MVERIPNPPPKQIIDGSKKMYSEGYTHQASFYYPKEGGIQSFVNSLFDKIKTDCHIKLNTEITSFNKKQNKLEIQTKNSSYSNEHDKIITTIPLTNMLEGCSSIDSISDLNSEIKKLEYLGIIYGVVEVESVIDENIFAITVPDSNIIFHRISYLSNILSLNKDSKNKKHVFLFEISFIDKSTLKTDIKLLGKQILEGMRLCNLTVENNYNFIDINMAEKAYVVYNLAHRRTVDTIIRTLRRAGIYPVGRFGSHEYLNMDQVMINCKLNLDELLTFK